MKMNKTTLVTIVFTLLMVSPMLAQIGTPGDDGPGGPGDAAPIDGLIAIGLAAGAYFGTKKIKSKN